MQKEGENLCMEEVGNERDVDLPLCAIQDAPETQVSETRALLCHQPPCQGEAALTFVAVAHRVEVDVVLVAAEEEEAEPGVEGIDGHDEEDADDVALLLGNSVIPQVCVDLQSARCARVVATTGQEGNQKYPEPTGLQEAHPMSALLLGVRAPLAFHHRPIAVDRHVRQAPSQSLEQSLPQNHVEIGSLPQGCARRVSSSLPAPVQPHPSAQSDQLAPGLPSAARICAAPRNMPTGSMFQGSRWCAPQRHRPQGGR